MKRNFITLFAPAILLLALSTPSFAGLSALGSFSYSSVFGDPTYVGADVASATSFTFGLDTVAVTGRTGDFLSPNCPTSAECVPSLSRLDINGNPGGIPNAFNLVGIVVTFDGATILDRYSYTITAFTRTTTGTDTVTYLTNGTFSDSQAVFNNAFSSMQLQINQSGASVSLAGTFSTPASFQVAPEPASLLLLGSALVGLGLIGRKRLAR